jgi:hypothetical protein
MRSVTSHGDLMQFFLQVSRLSERTTFSDYDTEKISQDRADKTPNAEG